MKTLKAFLVVGIFTALCGWGLVALDVGAHHMNPLWALGTSVAFITILIIDVWLFFAIAEDEPLRWGI